MPFIRNSAGNVVWSDDDGSVKYRFGNVGGGNYTEVEADGTVIANGDAKMWKDLNFRGTLAGGASAPDFINFDTTNIEVLAFDGGATSEEAFAYAELQHDYTEGTDLKPHVHWAPSTAAAGNVKWNLEMLIIRNGATLYSNTISVTDAAGGTAWDTQYAAFPTITGTTFQIGDQIGIRFYRNPGDAADTYGADAVLAFTFGFHYEVDALGSRSEVTKA